MENLSELKQHLLELEQNLLEPETRSTPSEIAKWLADDFFEFGSSGKIWYKKDAVGPEGLSIREMTLTDFEIYPLSEKAVLATYRVHDQSRRQITLRSSIWKLQEGRWQMSFHQGTVQSKENIS